MQYRVIRADHKKADNVMVQGKEQSWDYYSLHVIFTDVDGENSVDKFSIQTRLLQMQNINGDDLKGKIVNVDWDRMGKRPISIRILKG